MSKYVSRLELPTAINAVRTNLILSFRGKPLRPYPKMPAAIARAEEFIEEQLDEILFELDSQIPTDRFTVDELFAVAALKYAYLVQYPVAADSDEQEFNYNRPEIERVVTQGIVGVSGLPSPSVHKWQRSTWLTSVQRKFHESNWMEHKRGHAGINTKMFPSDRTHALHTLPVAPRSSAGPTTTTVDTSGVTPSIYLPSVPRLITMADPGWLSHSTKTPSTPTVDTSGAIGSTEHSDGWLNLRFEMSIHPGVTPAACWSYDNKRGRKAAVLYALRKAGVRVQDRPNGEFYMQSWLDPVKNVTVQIRRNYTDRWVLLPEGMTRRDLLHLVEGKC